MNPGPRRAIAVLVAFGAAGCVSSLMEGISTARNVSGPSTAEPSGPEPRRVAHGTLSELPTSVLFATADRFGASDVAGWTRSELDVDVAVRDTIPGPDGATFVRFGQVHGGVPVRGTAWNARLENGRVAELTGLLHADIDVDPSPRIQAPQAREAITREAPNLTEIGEAELEIVPRPDSGSWRFYLAYRFHLMDPDQGTFVGVDVDARTGEIRGAEPESWAVASTGQGQTTDGRTVTFGTQPTSEIPAPPPGEIEIVDLREGYRLFDPVRNLHTLSLGGATEVSIDHYRPHNGGIGLAAWEAIIPGHDIIEEDNVWESTPQAVDVHWGLTAAYDYFASAHGRRGWDGQNGYLSAHVDYYRDFSTAFLSNTGSWGDRPWLAFGDGGSVGRPLTTLDIVAHEYTHAVTGHIVDLGYNGESGSIKEGIADIFGTVVEFAAGQGDWIIGAQIPMEILHRNLRDPKSGARPDTYEGEHWGEYQSSFGLGLGLQETSRYQNSTIMSHWFYLLSEGAEGENDNEDHYDIEGVGMDRAADLLYRALFRLSPSADYKAVREATTEVARRLYGRCSEELRQVTNAWNAVGVGAPFCDCFEGSFDYLVEGDDGPAGMKLYVRDEDFAAEVTAQDGSTRIMNTTAGDPYWHVQGQPDLPETGPMGPMWRYLFQGRRPFVRPVPPVMSRKDYVAYRNEHRTGETRDIGDYTAYEYRLEGGTVWATEDVCMDITDFGALLMARPSGLGEAMRQVFFGFPVRMEANGEVGFWIENIREHEVADRYFQR